MDTLSAASVENSSEVPVDDLSVVPGQLAASKRFLERLNYDVEIFSEYRDFEIGKVVPCEIVGKEKSRPTELRDLPPYGETEQSDPFTAEWNEEFIMRTRSNARGSNARGSNARGSNARGSNATVLADLKVTYAVNGEMGKIQRWQVQNILESSFDRESKRHCFVVVVSRDGFVQEAISFCQEEVFQKCQDKSISLLLFDISSFEWHHPVADCRAYSLLPLFQRHTAKEQIENVLSWIKDLVPLSQSIGSIELSLRFGFDEHNVKKALRIAADQFDLNSFLTTEYGLVVSSG